MGGTGTAGRLTAGTATSGPGVRRWLPGIGGGAAFLTVETSLDAADLAAPLEILRSNWTRWGNEGFDAGEVNVARLRLAGDLPVGPGVRPGRRRRRSSRA